MIQTQNNPKGILFILLGMATFSIQDALIKFIYNDASLYELYFGRTFVALVLLVGYLKFSNDTIIFDTSFHSIGTPTKILTVYNQNNFNITTNILLSSSNSGVFRMNIDGEPVENLSLIHI